MCVARVLIGGSVKDIYHSSESALRLLKAGPKVKVHFNRQNAHGCHDILRLIMHVYMCEVIGFRGIINHPT